MAYFMSPRNVLDKLKEKFSIRKIHNSLVDLVEQKYLYRFTGQLVASILELLHEEEGLPPCMTIYANGSGKNITRVEKIEAAETSLEGNTG